MKLKKKQALQLPKPPAISVHASVLVTNVELARLSKNQRKAFMIGLAEIIEHAPQQTQENQPKT